MSQSLFFFIFFTFALHVIFPQQDFKGQVVDSDTKLPLPYVNIGFFDRGIGTVSDEEGIFHLSIDTSQVSAKDTIRFSSLGYKALKKGFTELKFVFNEYPKIELKPDQIKLNEVIVTDKRLYEVNDLVGYQNYGEKVYGYWKDNISLGGELATKIRVRKGLRKLNTLFFEVFSNPSDSILLRINFYELGKFKKEPGNNLNTSGKHILHTIYPRTELAIVDLEPYNIFVKDDFLISLELLRVYGNKPIGLVLTAASRQNTYSIRKQVSQGNWEVLPASAMAYYLNTTHYSKKNKVDTKVAKSKKLEQNLSGFIFSARKPLRNIRITNLFANEETFSNEKGRYTISGKKGDIIRFKGKGFKQLIVKLSDRKYFNVNMIEQ